MAQRLTSIAVLLLVLGCPTPGPAEQVPAGPGFYGQLLVVDPGGNASAAALPWQRLTRAVLPESMQRAVRGLAHAPPRLNPPPAPRPITPLVEQWRPGEIIVATAAPQRANLPTLRAALGDALASISATATLLRCNDNTTCLWELRDAGGVRLGAQATRAAAALVRRASGVRWATTNNLAWPLALPNDTYVRLQWHYNLMNLPAAWDITTGDSAVHVAVLDTGIDVTSNDFGDRLGQGADLISDPSVANDGDGRDMDPSDPGDSGDGGSFHGTHTAGTVGAATNNGFGVAGVSWAGTILPVRVLGIGGGTAFDIIGGILWSVGVEVEGVARNTTPAAVVSLSLGGPGSSEAYEEAIQTAVDRNALVIVAAGNNGVDAATFAPASVANAITVGATDVSGARAPYSNYGSILDVMAPGGDLRVDTNDDGYVDGILSTLNAGFGYLQGTSMAAPHVAGLAVLMKTLRPELTQAEASQILRETARPEAAFACDLCGGAALVDAAAVLARLGSDPEVPFLSVSPSSVLFMAGREVEVITVRNSGGGTLRWQASLDGAPAEFTVTPAAGVLGAKEAAEVTVRVQRSTQSGTALLVFTAPGQERVVELRYAEAFVPRAPQPDTAIVAALVDVDGEYELATLRDSSEDAVVFARREDDFRFALQPLPPGQYLLVALSDDDGDGEFGEETEGIGLYPSLNEPQLVQLEENQALLGVDFLVRPGFDEAGPQCPPNSMQDGAVCVCGEGFVVGGDGSSCVPR